MLLYTATRKGFISWDWLAPNRKRTAKSEGSRCLSAIPGAPNQSSKWGAFEKGSEEISSKYDSESELEPGVSHPRDGYIVTAEV